MAFYVYILASQRNGTLYVGSTDDVVRRVWQHREGALPGFTREHGVRRLVHVETYATREDAALRERKLKRWRRAWKVALVETDNPEWNDLYHTLVR